MKRTEIKTGMKVYYAPGSNYAERDGVGQGEATIVYPAAYEIGGPSRFRRADSRRYAECDPTDAYRMKRARALIEIDRYGSPQQILAPYGHLRGPFEEVAAEVARVREAIADSRRRETERARRTSEDTDALAARLRELLGLPQPASIWYSDGGVMVSRSSTGRIELDRETARKIIAELDAHQECPLTPSGESAL